MTTSLHPEPARRPPMGLVAHLEWLKLSGASPHPNNGSFDPNHHPANHSEAHGPRGRGGSAGEGPCRGEESAASDDAAPPQGGGSEPALGSSGRLSGGVDWEAAHHVAALGLGGDRHGDFETSGDLAVARALQLSFDENR